MNNKLRRRISAFLGIILIFYVGNQIYQANKAKIETEMANYATVSDSIETRGFAVRDEVAVPLPANGAVDFSISDGDRVSKGDAIANVYSDKTGASVQNQVNRLTRELEGLESLNKIGDSYVTNPGAVNDEIYKNLNDILVDVNKFNFMDLQNKRDEFQMAVNHKNLVTGKETVADYAPRIQEIKSELAALEGQRLEPVSVIGAPQAGYFISRVDGYEKIIDIEEAVDLQPAQIKKMMETKVEKQSDANVGKVCRAFTWYVAVVLSESEAIGLEGIENVKLEIPFATTQQIPAKIAAKNLDPETKEVAVIFACLNMDSELARIRNESIQIIINTYSGVLVNEDSIYFEDLEHEVVDEEGNYKTVTEKNVKGVYILKSDRLEFVQIFTNKTVNGYAICKTELNEDEKKLLYTKNTISLYDEVVSRSEDLYDGKIV